MSLKLNGEGPKIVYIDSNEAGPITAGDINVDQDVEILNPDHHIATLNGDHRFYMEMVINKGRGYVSAEKNKQGGQPIGVVPVDSIYTPVRKVNYTVESTRVGQMIADYDKLTIEVWTNGSYQTGRRNKLGC